MKPIRLDFAMMIIIPAKIFLQISSIVRIVSVIIFSIVISLIAIFYPSKLICQQEEFTDSLLIAPNQLSYGLDKQLNIYGFNFMMNYGVKSNFGNLTLNQKYLGTAYVAGATILQDDEEFGLKYNYPLNSIFSFISSSDFVLVSNKGSSELNKLQRLNLLGGGRISYNENTYLDILAGAEDNLQMSIQSKGSIFKISGLFDETELEGYRFSGSINGELLFLNLDRVNQNLGAFVSVNRQFDNQNTLSANISYKLLDRFNALRREKQYINDNNLNFDYSLESRYNNLIVSDINLGFGLFENLAGLVRLYLSNNNISRSFSEYVVNDPRTSIRQSREQLRITVNPEFSYKSDILDQTFGFLYSFESDINSVIKINNISDADYNNLRSRSYDLDNISSNFRFLLRSAIRLSANDTINISGITSILRFDTPSNDNNSDRDEFLGLVSFGYSRKFSSISSLRLDAEMQFNHQVNLKASRSASNFWMRSIKLAPSIIIQTKNFFMRPQPYVLANYTVYDFEGFAPGIKSFSLRQIGYNDSVSIIFSNNLYLGTRIDLIYKETGTLLWSDFKESPVNGNLKLFYKIYAGYYDERLNVAVGTRYFNLTQRNFTASAFVNSDYKTESFAPEVIISLELAGFATLKLNGWYEFQTINDTFRNEIPNIIINTIIKL